MSDNEYELSASYELERIKREVEGFLRAYDERPPDSNYQWGFHDAMDKIKKLYSASITGWPSIPE
jgi:hypothetical protein